MASETRQYQMASRTWYLFNRLETYLKSRIPGSRLEKTPLPQAPELFLYLINKDYPPYGLKREHAQALMDNPPYWAFCWASGQVLARHLLDNPEWVKGKTVVDFGSGSGAVGIAAKLAGAKRVVLCDLDERALLAGELNARINAVRVELSAAMGDLLNGDVGEWIVTVADVFYDPDNLPLLEILLGRFAQVWVSGSRLRSQSLPGMEIVGTYRSHTVPDLDESHDFNNVTVYCSQRRVHNT
jgi:predicted nicotinamide N-methyase